MISRIIHKPDGNVGVPMPGKTILRRRSTDAQQYAKELGIAGQLSLNPPSYYIDISIFMNGSRTAAANGPLRDAWNIGVVCGIYLCASVSLWFADFRLKTEPPGAFGPRR
ncbi:MAG TPA: hypothetical protein VIV61_07145, partial [Candidatus Ozemobacteraceae bacterium]